MMDIRKQKLTENWIQMRSLQLEAILTINVTTKMKTEN